MRQARTDVSVRLPTRLGRQMRSSNPARPKVQSSGLHSRQISSIFIEERKEHPRYPMRKAVLGVLDGSRWVLRCRSRRHNIPHSAPTR